MPTLRQITCAIELGPGNTRLQEYGHKVTDGAAEAFIVAPETSEIPFHVRVTSDGYIAPGIAAYVFIDGEYQCNRNRLGLQFPEDGVSTNEYQINFKLRQKEEKTSAGTFIARDWYFTPLNTGNADKASNSKDFQDNVGTIEVVILRCKDGGGQKLSTDPAQTTVSLNPSPAVRAPSKREASVLEPSGRPASVTSKKSAMPGGFSDLGIGIFDGAGEEPGYYKQYRPKSLVGQEPLPGHGWDAKSGQYRYFHDQDPFINLRDQEGSRYRDSYPAERYHPQTYTVAGGFSYQESVPSQESRIGGPKTFVPQTSPGFDFSTRRQSKSSEKPNRSTYDFTRGGKLRAEQATRQHDPEQIHRRPETEPSSRSNTRPKPTVGEPLQPGSGLTFVKGISHQMLEHMNYFHSELDKYAALKEDAKRYHDHKGIQQEILGTLHRQYGELVQIVNMLGRLYGVVKDAMAAMDRTTWRRASDLLFEMNLYPPPGLEVPPPEECGQRVLKAPQDGELPRSLASGWELIGNETTGGQPRPPQPSSRWSNASPKKPSTKSSNGKNPTVEVWATEDKDKPAGGGGGGGRSDDGNVRPAADDSWGHEEPNTPAAEKWNNDDSKKSAAVDGWDINDETKPATADKWGKENNSKPATDDDRVDGGGKKSSAGSRWSVKKIEGRDKQNNNGSWRNGADDQDYRGAQRSDTHRTGAANDGAGSESYSHGDSQPKPIVKPYWSEWTKKQALTTPKVPPREVYEYPASPLPFLPNGKQDKNITRAVHAGPGANYAHKLHRPEYLDTMAKPYAIFTFNYRSKAALETILKHKIDDGYIGEAEAEAKKHRLLSMRKDELVEELMKKASLAAESKAQSKATTNKNDERGTVDKGEPSAKPRSSRRESTSKRRLNRNDAWGDETRSQSSVKPQLNKIDGWENTGRKQSSAKPQSNHRDQFSRSRSDRCWDSKSVVKPSDSVSQHTSRSKKADNWDTESKPKNVNSKANWEATGWDAASKKSKSSPKKSMASFEHFEAAELQSTKPRGEVKW